MSLTIYYSDRIEDLADDLKEKLGKERRASDPFAFSTVVVPNTNIAKWLQIDKFSDTRELCVGVEFPFMEKRLTDLLRRNLPKDRKFHFQWPYCQREHHGDKRLHRKREQRL